MGLIVSELIVGLLAAYSKYLGYKFWLLLNCLLLSDSSVYMIRTVLFLAFHQEFFLHVCVYFAIKQISDISGFNTIFFLWHIVHLYWFY